MRLRIIDLKQYVKNLETLMYEHCMIQDGSENQADLKMFLVEEIVNTRNLIYQSCVSLRVSTPIGELPIDIAKQYVSYMDSFVDLTKNNNLKIQVANVKNKLLEINLNTMIECSLKYKAGETLDDLLSKYM